MVGLPAHSEPVDAPPRAKRRSPAVVADKSKLPAADGAATRRTMARILGALAHSGLLSISVNSPNLHTAPRSHGKCGVGDGGGLQCLAADADARRKSLPLICALRAKGSFLAESVRLAGEYQTQEECNGRARSFEGPFRIVF